MHLFATGPFARIAYSQNYFQKITFYKDTNLCPQKRGRFKEYLFNFGKRMLENTRGLPTYPKSPTFWSSLGHYEDQLKNII